MAIGTKSLSLGGLREHDNAKPVAEQKNAKEGPLNLCF